VAAQQGRPPEVAEILRSYAPPLDCLGADRRRAVRDITCCRTAALGGHLHKCDVCGHEVPLYNSCRNRHCPKCQNLEQARWVEQQVRELLPVHYFHVVFTVPACVQPLFVRDRRQSYALLFAAVWETLGEVCRRRLGVTPGMIAVLHTWSQTLVFHPHVHCIVTGGGIDASGERWISSRPDYFLPVRVLSRVFRAKLLQALEGSMEPRCRARGMAILQKAVSQPWVVYSKSPLTGPQQVVRYLGRYTHRIAISNERIVSIAEGHVCFRYRDRRHGNRAGILTVTGSEFARRFLQHVLPKRFVRLRHYGLFANANRRARIAEARLRLGGPLAAQPEKAPAESWQDLYRRVTGREPDKCPACGRGRLSIVATFAPARAVTSGRGP
jgi:predicted nucleic acid-binding Zn ribbon protein